MGTCVLLNVHSLAQASPERDGQPSEKAVAGVDNTARRHMDIEEFRAKAAKREIEESELDGLSAHEIKQLKRRSMPLHCARCSAAHISHAGDQQMPHICIRVCCLLLLACFRHPCAQLQHTLKDMHGCAERDPLHQGVIVKRDHLQGRDYKLDLAARLNKTQVISNNTPLNQQVCRAQLAAGMLHRLDQQFVSFAAARWASYTTLTM